LCAADYSAAHKNRYPRVDLDISRAPIAGLRLPRHSPLVNDAQLTLKKKLAISKKLGKPASPHVHGLPLPREKNASPLEGNT